MLDHFLIQLKLFSSKFPYNPLPFFLCYCTFFILLKSHSILFSFLILLFFFITISCSSCSRTIYAHLRHHLCIKKQQTKLHAKIFTKILFLFILISIMYKRRSVIYFVLLHISCIKQSRTRCKKIPIFTLYLILAKREKIY